MKIRHKLLLFGVLVAALTALAVFLAGGVLIRRSVGDRVKERLEGEARLLADVLARDPSLLPEAGGRPGATAGAAPDGTASAGSPAASTSVPTAPASSVLLSGPDAFADLVGRSLGMRITIVASDGTVLGDSSLDPDQIARVENHAGRPEIAAARQRGLGISDRWSNTVHDELNYLAERVDRNGTTVGFVRMAIPASEIQRVTGSYSLTLAGLSFVILLAVAMIGYAIAVRFSRPIEEMSRTADAIAAGGRDREVEYESDDEIGRLGAAINRMTRSLSERIGELSAEKKLTDAILGGMKEGLLVVDRDRHILLFNDALRWMLDIRDIDPEGRPLIEVVRNEMVVAGFDAALERAEEFRGIARAGAAAERSFDISVGPLTDPAGLQVGAIGIFSDVTRLAALESLRRDFVADVSHELRTPLTSIKAFVETLLAGGLEDTSNNRRFLEIVKKHSDRMEAILDDLTDLSLIETGAVALEIERLDLGTIGRELVESLRPKAVAAGVGIESAVPTGTVILADRRRLEQILLNLLENAIKFNRPGGSVALAAMQGAASGNGGPGGGYLEVEVADTGIGIPPGALDKIFHRFYRVDRARSREMGGTGLGLSIVKHLMNLHGGTVRVESEPGRGTRFILEFPNAPAGAPIRS